MTDTSTTATVRERVRSSYLSRGQFYHLAGGTLIATYVLMLLGAYTSAIGAGLSCPDWPTCYGTVVPFLHPEVMAETPYTTLQIFAEWSHRALAMVVGVLILVTALAAWRFKRHQRIVVWSAILALVVLPIQVALGMFTVTELLEPAIVTAHLGTATIILLGLTTTTLSSWLLDRRPTSMATD